MKVKDLIEYLQTLDPELEVFKQIDSASFTHYQKVEKNFKETLVISSSPFIFNEKRFDTYEKDKWGITGEKRDEVLVLK